MSNQENKIIFQRIYVTSILSCPQFSSHYINKTIIFENGSFSMYQNSAANEFTYTVIHTKFPNNLDINNEINTEIKIHKIDDNIPISKACLELISNMLCGNHYLNCIDYAVNNVINIITLEKNKELEKLQLIESNKNLEKNNLQLIENIKEMENNILMLIETNENLEKNNLRLIEAIHDKKQMIKLKQRI